jgi:hypothetical protein
MWYGPTISAARGPVRIRSCTPVKIGHNLRVNCFRSDKRRAQQSMWSVAPAASKASEITVSAANASTSAARTENVRSTRVLPRTSFRYELPMLRRVATRPHAGQSHYRRLRPPAGSPPRATLGGHPREADPREYARPLVCLRHYEVVPCCNGGSGLRRGTVLRGSRSAAAWTIRRCDGP